jgi:hypothetical protein
MARINPDKGFSRPEITQTLLKYMPEKSEEFAEEKFDTLLIIAWSRWSRHFHMRQKG